MPSYDELIKRKEYQPFDLFGAIHAQFRKLKDYLNHEPAIAADAQQARAERAERPATNPTVENVKKSFEESAAADARAIDGLSSERRGQKRKADEPTEEQYETFQDIASRVLAETANPNPNPYKILGLPGDATRREVDTRYKRLVLIVHPDKSGESNAEVFRKVKKARDDIVEALNASQPSDDNSTTSAAVRPPTDENDPTQQRGETDEAFLVRMFRAQKLYQTIIQTYDEAVQKATRDIEQLDRDIASLSANDASARKKFTDLRETAVKNTEEFEAKRSVTAVKLGVVERAIEPKVKVLLQRENAKRMLSQPRQAPIAQEHWVNKFKTAHGLDFGKRRPRKHMSLYSFIGRYHKRRPHVHPSKVVRKFMRAVFMLAV